ncbi:MAG: restriction endonuclease subunit S [Hydrogenophaga sp.]|nr:restriction endonuclease subunit S [Hydrogenophaga sp.]
MEAWQTKPIGEAFRVVNGGTPNTAVSAYWGGNHHWITPAEMGGLSSPYLSVTRRTLTEEGLRVGAELVPANSIILSSRAPIGHLVINEVPMAFNQGCKGLVPSIGIDTKFAYYFLLVNVPLLESLGTGATFKELSGGKLGTVPFRFPALPEQRRIVAILDEAFENFAISKANAEKNLQNARGLFKGYLEAVFTQGGASWVERLLGDVCEFENGDRGTNYPNRSEYVESGIPWINTGHIRPDGTLSTEAMNFITREKFNSLRSGKIQPGDLVYCLRGATLGKTALVAPLTEGAVASSLVILRPSPHLDSKFLYFFLTSPPGQGLIRRFENGAAQPNLGARSVARFPIPVPPVAEQQRVAAKFTEIWEATQCLAEIYERKVAALEALKGSLLHQAFSGALVTNSTHQQVEAVA